MGEAPSGGQSSCHQSVQTTIRGISSVAGWDSTVVQTECESTAVHSLAEHQIRPMQMDYLPLATQCNNMSNFVYVHHCFTEQVALLSQRLRNALCLSVVSFNSIIPQAQLFIISYFGFGFTSAYKSILFCCLRCNVEPCCHTHDSHPPWLCIARDRAWSISHCTQQRVNRARSSNTCRKRKTGQKMWNTNYDAAVLIARPDNRWFRDFSLPHIRCPH